MRLFGRKKKEPELSVEMKEFFNRELLLAAQPGTLYENYVEMTPIIDAAPGHYSQLPEGFQFIGQGATTGIFAMPPIGYTSAAWVCFYCGSEWEYGVHSCLNCGAQKKVRRD